MTIQTSAYWQTIGPADIGRDESFWGVAYHCEVTGKHVFAS